MAFEAYENVAQGAEFVPISREKVKVKFSPRKKKLIYSPEIPKKVKREKKPVFIKRNRMREAAAKAKAMFAFFRMLDARMTHSDDSEVEKLEITLPRDLSSSYVEEMDPIPEKSGISAQQCVDLANIFLHMDDNESGEVSFQEVVEFDLKLVPNKTQEEAQQDTKNLFRALHQETTFDMNDWVQGWIHAVKRLQTTAFLDQFIASWKKRFKVI